MRAPPAAVPKMNPCSQFLLWKHENETARFASASPRIGSASTRLRRATSHRGLAPLTNTPRMPPRSPMPSKRVRREAVPAVPEELTELPEPPSSPPSTSSGTRAKRSCDRPAPRFTPPAPGGHRNARYASTDPSPRIAVSRGRSCARSNASTRISTISGGGEVSIDAVADAAAAALRLWFSRAARLPTGARTATPSERPSAAQSRSQEGSAYSSTDPPTRASASMEVDLSSLFSSDCSASVSFATSHPRRKNPGARLSSPGWSAVGTPSSTRHAAVTSAPRGSFAIVSFESDTSVPFVSSPLRTASDPSDITTKTYGSHTDAATISAPSDGSEDGAKSFVEKSCVIFAPFKTRTPLGCTCTILVRELANTLPQHTVLVSVTSSTCSETSFSSSPVSSTIVDDASAMTRYEWNGVPLEEEEDVLEETSEARYTVHVPLSPGSVPASTSVTSSGWIPRWSTASAPFLPWPHAATSSARCSTSPRTDADAPTVRSITGEMPKTESRTLNA
mmetsp:Transcript_15052/g.64455  ORF Transcript_15052/g.64455 Transcript_15052/m.64455 type:complete len:507 (+) Transcript_15052:2082-3602(+)